MRYTSLYFDNCSPDVACCATDWRGLLDLNLNGEVDVEDLILLLRRWK